MLLPVISLIFFLNLFILVAYIPKEHCSYTHVEPDRLSLFCSEPSRALVLTVITHKADSLRVACERPPLATRPPHEKVLSVRSFYGLSNPLVLARKPQSFINNWLNTSSCFCFRCLAVDWWWRVRAGTNHDSELLARLEGVVFVFVCRHVLV